ncbi:carboxymuconolactone decarboxylase family protein [Paraburkholderia sp. BL10I2N1]|uniref:carboxymuconolactone decarboxylase family protein n=1 Tax=Paraburkholderia sp. BL10I2N1 TaxID=1938796 RepID=UPI00105F90AE|nr:carboxymuconolactone decarboxylase family protein [Paraburkholderia sp. BL10I2N1]TDN61943.1 alkylhydroperoxidase/carboxymuconolactone decarboxylase family protein YurZ [Paraburkholderia sp. BL10I2N1]
MEQDAVDTTSLLLQSNLLRKIAPYTLGGYSRFRAIVDRDGAIPARIKALYVAVAATTKGYREMAKRELERARRLGLTYDEASAAAMILSSVRGEGAALSFISALESEYPGQSEVDVPMPEIEVKKDEAAQNFLRYFGTMPPSLGKLLELLPLGGDAYYLMREGTINGTALGPRYSELMLVVVLAADYSPLASVHIKGAKTAGATDTEVAEAIVCAVLTSGLSAWVSGATAMDAA